MSVVVNRQKWVIGNWKMNGSLNTNRALLEGLTTRLSADSVGSAAARVGVCAPTPYLSQLCEHIASAAQVGVLLSGAQDVSEHAAGAYTGQVSAAMLKEFGVRLVLVGHSERRQLNGESSEQVARKAVAAYAQGLVPVICVGETLAEREAGQAERVVAAQLAPCADWLQKVVAAEVIIAYEPVWAIGTGKTASAAEAQAMHAFIRTQLSAISPAAAQISVLYGGSVKASNAAELFGQSDIDGGLIGGASLIVDDFVQIIQAAM